MNLKVEILLPVNIQKLLRGLPRFIFLILKNPLIDRSRNTTRQADDSLGILPQNLTIYPRLAIPHSFKMAFRNQFLQVAPTHVILGKERHVTGPLAAGNLLPFFDGLGSEVDFAPHDRLHPDLVTGFVKANCSIQITMIGHRHRGHSQLLGPLRHILRPACSVERGILGVKVEVDKRIGHRTNSAPRRAVFKSRTAGWVIFGVNK